MTQSPASPQLPFQTFLPRTAVQSAALTQVARAYSGLYLTILDRRVHSLDVSTQESLPPCGGLELRYGIMVGGSRLKKKEKADRDWVYRGCF